MVGGEGSGGWGFLQVGRSFGVFWGQNLVYEVKRIFEIFW